MLRRRAGCPALRHASRNGHLVKQWQTTLTMAAANGASLVLLCTALFGSMRCPVVMGRRCAITQAMYGKTATNTTEGLPPSGMRVYVTNEAVLRQQFEASLAAAG